VLGGSRLGVSAMDSGICQTSTASPAEPGGLPFVLGYEWALPLYYDLAFAFP